MSMYSLWTWSVQPFGPALPHYINMEQSVDMVSSAFGPALLHYINMEQSVDVPWSIQPFGPALPHYINMEQSADVVDSAFWSCPPSLYKHGTGCGHGPFSLFVLPSLIT